jgi:hypothetical protein
VICNKRRMTVTVKQLIAELYKYDSDLPVYVHHPHEFWGEVETLEIREPRLGVWEYPRRLEIQTN